MKVFVSTADASGDLHAAALIESMRKRDPGLEVFGLGGEALVNSGLEPIVDQSEFAIAGLFEILGQLPSLLGGYRALRAALQDREPDLAIFVDSPDLNLPLAAVAHRAGRRVFYYVAPQVWAWRSGRIKQLRERADGVGVIFPFEEKPLIDAGVNALFVGHPLVDRMASVNSKLDRLAAAAELGLDLARPVLGLAPGSRHNEYEANLSVLLETARQLRAAIPGLQTQLVLAPTLEALKPEVPDGVSIVRGNSYAAMALCDCLIAAPGTVNIEAALMGVPMIVTHQVNRLSFEFIRRVARVPSACMVNLLAGEGVVPERMQWQSRPAALVSLAARLLRDPAARDQMRAKLAEVAGHLGAPGASDRAAQMAFEIAGRADAA